MEACDLASYHYRSPVSCKCSTKWFKMCQNKEKMGEGLGVFYFHVPDCKVNKDILASYYGSISCDGDLQCVWQGSWEG